eukprot:Hpha_TRINITY_DN36287_c0_g1::TRINITY_DN36287_c0_g1_i1::g.83207::m.83207
MVSAPALSMYAFGGCAWLLGAVTLFRPELMLRNLGLKVVGAKERRAGDYTLLFIRMAAMASFNMGAYYCYTAAHEDRVFFRVTVPFRMVTTAVFSSLYFTGQASSGVLLVA